MADETGLDAFFFAHNQSGTMVNVTNGTMGGVTSFFFNYTLTTNSSLANYTCAEISFNDTSGNINLTNQSCFITQPPLIAVPEVCRTFDFFNHSTDSVPLFSINCSGHVNINFGKIVFPFGYIIDNFKDDWLRFGGSLQVDELINSTGNVTAENVFLPQYIFPHTNETIPVLGANLWTNISFSQEETTIKQGITHIHNDNTNTTFTINVDGIYYISYNMDVIDTSASATDIDVAGRVILSNGTEIEGSVFETDIIRVQIETELSHEFLARLNEGDKILFQFTADDADVEMSTHGTFGDHPNSISVIIEKRSTLP